VLFRFSTWVILWVCCFGFGLSHAQGRPDISHLSYEAQSSIKIACAYAKTEGPATYWNCLSQQLKLFNQTRGIPDISNLGYETQSSIKIACAYAKTEGPASYARCISSQLTSIGLSPKY